MKINNRKTVTNPRAPIIAAIISILLLSTSAWPAPKAPPPSTSKPGAARPALPAKVEAHLAKERYEELIRLLRRGKTDLGGRRSFLLGHAYLKLEQYRPAVKAFQKALEQIPALENYSLLFLARAAIGAKDNAVARRALERLVKKGKKASRASLRLRGVDTHPPRAEAAPERGEDRQTLPAPVPEKLRGARFSAPARQGASRRKAEQAGRARLSGVVAAAPRASLRAKGAETLAENRRRPFAAAQETGTQSPLRTRQAPQKALPLRKGVERFARPEAPVPEILLPHPLPQGLRVQRSARPLLPAPDETGRPRAQARHQTLPDRQPPAGGGAVFFGQKPPAQRNPAHLRKTGASPAQGDAEGEMGGEDALPSRPRI